jgi:hypothetical protein
MSKTLRARIDSLDRQICMGDYTRNAARFAPVSSLHSEPNRNREGDKHAAPPGEIIPLMLLVLTQGRRAAWHHQIRATKPVLPSTTFFLEIKISILPFLLALPVLTLSAISANPKGNGSGINTASRSPCDGL